MVKEKLKYGEIEKQLEKSFGENIKAINGYPMLSKIRLTGEAEKELGIYAGEELY